MLESVQISVIVPVFNVEKYLRRCVESILSSQFEKFELILVNDGSTDQSCAICKWYEKNDGRVRLIDVEHRGVSAARNRGIRESRGKWIVFVDADDLISRDFLGIIVQEELDSQDLLIFDYAGADEGESTLKRVGPSLNVFPKKRYTKEGPFLVKCMLSCRQLMESGHTDLRSPCAKAYKRILIQRHSLAFPEDLLMGEDQIFQIEYLMAACRCAYIKNVVYFVETRPDSTTQQYRPDTWKQYLKFIHHLERTLRKYPCFSMWEDAYYNAVLLNLKGILVMGIFHPQNPAPIRDKYDLCRKVRRMSLMDFAVREYNRKTGDWTRKGLLFFFQLGYCPVVELICRIGHIRMKWKKR